MGSSAPPLPGQLPAAAPPDRVPLPEDELADLKMTEAEKMEFFLYCMQFDKLENEHQLKVNWLRARRLGLIGESEDDRQNRAALQALLAPSRRSGEPEAA